MGISKWKSLTKGCGLIVGKQTTPVFFFVLLGIIVFFLIYAGVRRSQQTPPPEPSLRQNRRPTRHIHGVDAHASRCSSAPGRPSPPYGRFSFACIDMRVA